MLGQWRERWRCSGVETVHAAAGLVGLVSTQGVLILTKITLMGYVSVNAKRDPWNMCRGNHGLRRFSWRKEFTSREPVLGEFSLLYLWAFGQIKLGSTLWPPMCFFSIPVTRGSRPPTWAHSAPQTDPAWHLERIAVGVDPGEMLLVTIVKYDDDHDDSTAHIKVF